MFSIFRKKKSEGSDFWWQSAFSASELAEIIAAYNPLGGGDAKEVLSSDSSYSLIVLVGYLKKDELREIGYKIIKRADEQLENETTLLNKHFYYAERGAYFYKMRDLDKFALSEATKSFYSQIELAPDAANFFKNKSDLGFIPAHAGYRQMRIILEKKGELLAAVELCEKAKSEGWKDDWDKQIDRLRKKLSKNK
jgi:hypothetical protein